MISQIWFCNHWHNGDVFIVKGYIQDLIKQLPNIKFYEGNVNSPKLLLDLQLNPIDSTVDSIISSGFQFGIAENILVINTWIGCFRTVYDAEGHPYGNWLTIHRMWMQVYDTIDQYLNVKLIRNPDPMAYVASTDWSYYNIGPADEFVKGKDRIVLLCNGLVRAFQSNIGLMEDVVSDLAVAHPTISFVCTAKFDYDMNIKNIYFTDDIFMGTDNGDINEIAYLSTHAELIVGKNSGPYMFTHVKDNILRTGATFLSLSHRPGESLAYGIEKGMYCNYYHSIKESPREIYNIISLLLSTEKKMIVV